MPDLLTYFKGSWEFEREIILSATNQHYAKAKGKAAFEQPVLDEKTLQYKESGKMTIDSTAQQTSFFRTYRYAITDAGLDIYFQDELTQNFDIYQRYSYESESHALIAKDKHLCNQDIYEGRFLLHDTSCFVHTTWIKGPHKDYFITTHFNRL